MNYRDYFTRDPGVCGGEPVIRGTRVLVRTVLSYLAEGTSVERILEDYPSITVTDISAVIAYAASSAREDLPGPAPLPPELKVA